MSCAARSTRTSRSRSTPLRRSRSDPSRGADRLGPLLRWMIHELGALWRSDEVDARRIDRERWTVMDKVTVSGRPLHHFRARERLAGRVHPEVRRRERGAEATPDAFLAHDFQLH